MPNLVFKFTVSADGQFDYEQVIPTGNWPYTHQDTVEFQCPKGPFTIRQSRIDAATPGLPDSFGGPIEAVQQGNVWVAQATVQDGLSAELRHELWESVGFISRYRYVFGVMNGADIAVDDTQTGIQTC